MITKTCKQCKKKFLVYNYRKKTAKFCSKKCVNNSFKKIKLDKYINFKCEICGKENSILKIKYNRAKHHFCSKSCYIIWEKKLWYLKKRNKVCPICNKKFMIHEFKTRMYKMSFCSQKCYLNYKKRNPIKGLDHYNWQGGKFFEPYSPEFNKQLKEQIRKRDNYICQECKYTEKQLGYKLSVHHIDYNKKNNDQSNLISLCKNCHSQTNFKREDWTNYFQSKKEIKI